MNKKILYGISVCIICVLLTGCCMNHEWTEATCTEPKTCAKCEKTEGEPLGHTWVEATCSEAKHCSVCGETEGEPLAHILTEANYQQAATCEVCGAAVGEPLKADFEEIGLVCNAELNTIYSVEMPCLHDSGTTEGKLVFSDYEIFESDETHEALEGYEWRAVTYTITYDDDNAMKYGVAGETRKWADYYNYDNYNENGIVNYNGMDYSDVDWDWQTIEVNINENIITAKYRFFIRVPKGYDGITVSIGNPSFELDELQDIANNQNELCIFRLK